MEPGRLCARLGIGAARLPPRPNPNPNHPCALPLTLTLNLTPTLILALALTLTPTLTLTLTVERGQLLGRHGQERVDSQVLSVEGQARWKSATSAHTAGRAMLQVGPSG